MKITMRDVNDVCMKDKSIRNRQVHQNVPQKTDKITLSAQDVKTDKQFVSVLKAQILNEVKSGAGSDVLNDLKNQVSAERYDINPADIVRKMLLSY